MKIINVYYSIGVFAALRHKVESFECRPYQHCFLSRDVYRCICMPGLKAIELPNTADGSKVQNLIINNTSVTTFNKDLFTNLQYVLITHSKLEILLKSYFPSTVVQIDLSYNQISYVDGKAFNGLMELTTLNLSYNRLKSIIADAFVGLKSMKILDLTGNQLTAIDAGSLLNLQSLRLAHNQILQIPVTANNVVRLYLNNNKISGLKKQKFKDLDKLRVLDLRHNEIISIEEGLFDRNFLLESIDLSRNHIEIIPRTLFKNLRNLKELDLSNNRLQMAFVDWFKHLKENSYLGCFHPGGILQHNRWDCCDCDIRQFQDFLNNRTAISNKCGSKLTKNEMECNVPPRKLITSVDMTHCMPQGSSLAYSKHCTETSFQHAPHTLVFGALIACLIFTLIILAYLRLRRHRKSAAKQNRNHEPRSNQHRSHRSPPSPFIYNFSSENIFSLSLSPPNLARSLLSLPSIPHLQSPLTPEQVHLTQSHPSTSPTTGPPSMPPSPPPLAPRNYHIYHEILSDSSSDQEDYLSDFRVSAFSVKSTITSEIEEDTFPKFVNQHPKKQRKYNEYTLMHPIATNG